MLDGLKHRIREWLYGPDWTPRPSGVVIRYSLTVAGQTIRERVDYGHYGKVLEALGFIKYHSLTEAERELASSPQQHYTIGVQVDGPQGGTAYYPGDAPPPRGERSTPDRVKLTAIGRPTPPRVGECTGTQEDSGEFYSMGRSRPGRDFLDAPSGPLPLDPLGEGYALSLLLSAGGAWADSGDPEDW